MDWIKATLRVVLLAPFVFVGAYLYLLVFLFRLVLVLLFSPFLAIICIGVWAFDGDLSGFFRGIWEFILNPFGD
jgi:hypothetical protein